LIVTGTPRITFLAQSAILQKEFRVPQRIKLISLCHSSMFDMIYPSITHIEIPLSEMGEYATKYLIDTIAGLPASPADFRCALKIGHSTL
jgi:DNA-binding LacI/PurR family transcriptional regulator